MITRVCGKCVGEEEAVMPWGWKGHKMEALVPIGCFTCVFA